MYFLNVPNKENLQYFFKKIDAGVKSSLISQFRRQRQKYFAPLILER
jgi:hypothetical protein